MKLIDAYLPAGDSRAIIVQKGGKVAPLSDDHKVSSLLTPCCNSGALKLPQPSRADEKKRIEDLGGKVVFWGRWRVEGVLAVSRAIGDVNLKPYVICDPECTCKEIDDDDMFLVLASDGVWYASSRLFFVPF
jgi:serine/threonine protein phosphatase PrpC